MIRSDQPIFITFPYFKFKFFFSIFHYALYPFRRFSDIAAAKMTTIKADIVLVFENFPQYEGRQRPCILSRKRKVSLVFYSAIISQHLLLKWVSPALFV